MNSEGKVNASQKKKICDLARECSYAVYRIVHNCFRRYGGRLLLKIIQTRLDNHFYRKSGSAALRHAIHEESLTLLKLLILVGTELNNKTCCEGSTALDFAIRYDKISCVRILVENSVDIRIPDSDGLSPLQLALVEGRVEIVKILLSKIYKDIIFREDMDIVKFLLDKDELIIASSNFSPLLLFAAHISDDALKLVLSKSSLSNINAIESLDNSLLKLLIRKENKEMITHLIDYGVDLNMQIGIDTPLTYAVSKEHLTMVSFLLEKGADPNIPDRNGYHPIRHVFDIKVPEEIERIIKLLMEYGANINATSVSGDNLLHYACKLLHSRVSIGTLLELKVDINAVNQSNQTPLEDVLKMDNHFASYFLDILSWEFSITPLVAEIAVMRENHEYVSEKNIECCKNERVRNLYKGCENEISRMKEERIRGQSRICLYDFLTNNLNKLATLAKNKTAMKNLELKSYEKKFPIYSQRLQRSTERATCRLEEIERIVEMVRGRVQFPFMIFEQIFGYLNDAELKKSKVYFCLAAEFLNKKE